MFSVKQVEKALCSMYRYGIDAENYDAEDVENMLKEISFPALARIVQHNAVNVHSFTVESDIPGMFRYRGRELFGQRAALLYIDETTSEEPAMLLAHADSETPNKPVTKALNAIVAFVLCRVSMSYVHELWLLEHGQLLMTGRVKISFQCPPLGSLEAIYREQWRYPWENGASVPLMTLTKNLREMCEFVKRGECPVYEL